MRKVALFSAAVLVCALGMSAVAFAIQGNQSIAVKTTNNRAGSTAKPRSVGNLTVTLDTQLIPGEAPWAATHAVVHFDKNLVFNPRGFASCSVSRIRSDDSKCPSGSKVGSGTAAATVFSGGAQFAQVAPTITAYNGPRGPSGPRIFLLLEERQFNVRDVMTGSLKADTGSYGRKLDVTIPPKLQNAGLPGIVVSLTHFQTRVGGTRKGTPFIALKGCSGGKLAYKADVSFTDGTTKSGTSTSNCRRS
jgi:hypothetical protein